MKTWRWFVGQVARLRRSIVGVFPLAVQRRRPADDLDVADEPAAGPPEHWVERVRRGAPGLLEPSLRQETAGPQPTDRVPSQAELEPISDSRAAPQREHGAPEPRISSPPPEPPARARLVPKVLRRKRSSPAEPPAPVESPPAPAAEHLARELHAATRRVTETAGPAPREQHNPRPAEEPGQTSPSVAEEPERLPQASEVVELKAPARQRATPAERAASPEPIRAVVARPNVATPRQAELAVEELRSDRRRAGPAPAPRREASLERPREPTIRAPKPSPQPAPTRASHAEPLPVVELPWPDLPPPLEGADDDEVEAALRTWEHRRRIDHEQTRL